MSNPHKWSWKEQNWVSRAVLSTDKDDGDLFLKIYTGTCEKRLIMHKYMILSIFNQL